MSQKYDSALFPTWEPIPYPVDPKTICSFCERQFSESHLISGKNNVLICRECVGICNDVIAERKVEEREQALIQMMDIEKTMPDSYQPRDLMERLYDEGYRKEEAR